MVIRTGDNQASGILTITGEDAFWTGFRKQAK